MTADVALGELAIEFGCELVGDPSYRVASVATLANADSGSLTFLANPSYQKYLAKTKAGCVVLHPDAAEECPSHALLHEQPYEVYARIAARLYPPTPIKPGISGTAVVAGSANVSADAQIDDRASISAGAQVHAGCYVGPGAVIGANCTIGKDSRIGANVVLGAQTILGERCAIQPGAVLGSDGFGYAPTATGWLTVPQVGRVVLGNDVDVGANATIDRGAIGDTVLEDGVKIDNLVQIAHNVRIGAHTAMAAQVGIAGSTTIGKNCMFAGHSGAVGHVTITDHVVVSGKTMVTRDISEPGQYGAGLPAMPIRLYRRVVARIRQIDKLAQRISDLEKQR